MSSTSKQRLVSILEKRSHAGTYIYIFIWLLIALSIDYHREFPTFLADFNSACFDGRHTIFQCALQQKAQTLECQSLDGALSV